jgi:hypothetical protein
LFEFGIQLAHHDDDHDDDHDHNHDHDRIATE